MSELQVPEGLGFLTNCTLTFVRDGQTSTISLADSFNPEFFLQPGDIIVGVEGKMPDFLVSGCLGEYDPNRFLYFEWLVTLPEGYANTFPVVLFTDSSRFVYPFIWVDDGLDGLFVSPVGKVVAKLVW
jgi:hypothetical protein